jgi:hypothetical protein
MIAQPFPLVFDAATTLNNSTLNTTALNLSGFNSGMIVVRLGTIAATGGLTVAKLQTSDDGSTWVDVTGGAFGGTGAPALPGDTSDDTFIGFVFKKTGLRQRYRAVLTAGTAVNTIITAVMGFGFDAVTTPAATYPLLRV